MSSPKTTPTVIPENYPHCHPQLDWGSRLFFYSSLILKERNIPWILHQVQNYKKYFLDSRFRGNDRNRSLEWHYYCHPQLDWGSRFFLFFFNTNRKVIYLGLCIKSRITKILPGFPLSREWHFLFLSFSAWLRIHSFLFLSFFVILEILYRELKVTCHPQLDWGSRLF